VLYPYILFSSREESVSSPVLKHEWVHVQQIRRVGFLRFYFRYLAEYVKGRRKGLSHTQAYLAISFEIEAYGHQKNL